MWNILELDCTPMVYSPSAGKSALSAMAACKITKNTWVFFCKDANAYTAARSSKKTNNVVQKGSHAWCDKVCGDYARVIVNEVDNTKRWFKVSALKEYEEADEYTQTTQPATAISTMLSSLVTLVSA